MRQVFFFFFPTAIDSHSSTQWKSNYTQNCIGTAYLAKLACQQHIKEQSTFNISCLLFTAIIPSLILSAGYSFAETSALHLKLLFTIHHPTRYLQNEAVNEAGEPFKATALTNVQRSPCQLSRGRGGMGRQTEMLHQRAVDLHCRPSSSSLLNIKGSSQANKQD